jgi:hypothetical protein
MPFPQICRRLPEHCDVFASKWPILRLAPTSRCSPRHGWHLAGGKIIVPPTLKLRTSPEPTDEIGQLNSYCGPRLGIHVNKPRCWRGNRVLQLRSSLEGLACRVFRDSILVVRGMALWPTAQDSPSGGRGVNLTSVPCIADAHKAGHRRQPRLGSCTISRQARSKGDSRAPKTVPCSRMPIPLFAHLFHCSGINTKC